MAAILAAVITLHTFPGRPGLESLSPFCMKVEVYLKARKLPYRTILGNPRAGPKQKLPFIEVDGQRIADSATILEHFEKSDGALDAGLDEVSRARAHVIRRTFEEGLYFVMLWSRWAEDASWAVMKGSFDAVPAALRFVVAPIVRGVIVKSTVAQGTGRHSRDEIYAIGARDLAAVSALLGEEPFFAGNTLRTIDLVAYAFLANIVRFEVDTPLKEAAARHPNLGRFVDRMGQALA